MVLRDDLNGKVVFLDINVGVVANGLHESALNLCPGIVGMVQDTELGMTALTVQVKLSVLFPVEVHTPVHEFLYLLRSVAYHLLHGLAVVDIVAGDDRVGNMLVEGVRLHIRHTGNAALGKRGVGLVQ